MTSLSGTSRTLGKSALHLDRHVGQGPKSPQQGLIILRSPRFSCCDRKNCPQMAGPKSPQMQISYLVAICLDCGSHTFGHALVGVHVEQNGPRTAHEAVSPNSDNDRSNQTHHWIHPCPTQQAPKQKADDDRQRHCRVRENVMIAACILLSRLAELSACSCSANSTVLVSSWLAS